SLGDRAPATEIRANRFLESGNGKRTVNRTIYGDALVCKTRLGAGSTSVSMVPPAQARLLERPGTWLTWRFREMTGRSHWELVLVDRHDKMLWAHSEERLNALETKRLTWPQPWFDEGLLSMENGYCVTLIHDVTPTEVLRRLEAGPDQISLSTWSQL